MTILETFKANLKAATLDRQAPLLARADEIDAASCKEPFESRKRARLHAEAAALRDEACALGDRYFALIA